MTSTAEKLWRARQGPLVDSRPVGSVRYTEQLGGQVHVDADGFIAATFTGKSLDEVKGLLNLAPLIQKLREENP